METKLLSSPSSFVDKPVVPGDVVLDLTYMANHTIKLGGGLCQDCDAITVIKAGMLRFVKPNKYWVESSQKRYVPCAGDNVLGIVVDAKQMIPRQTNKRKLAGINSDSQINQFQKKI